MFNIQAISPNGANVQVRYDKRPDLCPICHKQISPNIGPAFYKEGIYDETALQIIFRCPNDKCLNIFLGFYKGTPQSLFLVKSLPSKNTERKFSDIIKQVSLEFEKIYNQAYFAEQNELDMVCGPGYRKALEFLIKDYLISKKPEDAEKIKKEFLGKTIEKRVDQQQLKIVAKRAVWLGNDETHYERKWVDKDVKDLKDLIELAIRWIEADKLTEKLLQDMPDEQHEN